MSYCVECSEKGFLEVEACHDDYLCSQHRDTMDGLVTCSACAKKFSVQDGTSRCPTCRAKDVCEYCQELYSHKRKKEGVRFKGLCKNCAGIALASVPLLDDYFDAVIVEHV